MAPTRRSSAASVFSVNLLGKFNKKGDLLHHLNDVHKALAQVAQDTSEHPKELRSIAAQIVSPKLLSHSDKDVRLITTCCLVDILRCYAPDAPYSNDEMILVFNAIITQLHGLQTIDTNNNLHHKSFYILSSISTVKSCVVPVIMGQSGIDRANEIVIEMFDALFSSIRNDHSEEIFGHAANVLQSCIEEFDDFSAEILDTLLLPLLPHNKSDHPAAYQLAVNVLRKVNTILEGPISTLLNQILVGISDHEDGMDTARLNGGSTELTEHVYALIFELHIVSSSLLSRVIPNVCVQLQVEEVDIRTKAVKLLGKLFCSPHADYARDYGRSFRDFCGRFVDTSADIRLEMIVNAGAIMKAKPNLCSGSLEENLSKRLRDHVEEVRLQALNTLIEVASIHANEFNASTFVEIGERVKDRRVEIKHAALIGLAKIYCQNVSASLCPLASIGLQVVETESLRDEESDSGSGVDNDGSSRKRSHLEDKSKRSGGKREQSSKMKKQRVRAAPQMSVRDFVSNQSMLTKLSFVPGLLLKCWSYPDLSTKHVIITMLQEQILPKRFVSDNTGDDSNDEFGNSAKPALDSQTSLTTDSARNSSEVDLDDVSERRASALLLMNELLTEDDRRILANLIAFKTKIADELSNFVQVRAKVRKSISAASSGSIAHSFNSTSSSSQEADEENKEQDHLAQLRRCMMRIVQLAPPQDRRASLLEKLYVSKDKIVFRLLNTCLSAEENIIKMNADRDELRRRLDSRSALGEYTSMLYDTAGCMLVNSSMTRSILKYWMRCFVNEESIMKDELLNTSGLLCLLAKYTSKTFVGTVHEIMDMLGCGMELVEGSHVAPDTAAHILSQCITIIDCICEVFSTESKESRQFVLLEIFSHLKNCSNLETCERLADLCPHLAFQFDRYHDAGCMDILKDQMQKLCKKNNLSLSSKHLGVNLQTLASLSKFPRVAYLQQNFQSPQFLAHTVSIGCIRNQIQTFVMNTLLKESTGGKLKENNVDGISDALCAGISVLTNVLATEEECRELEINANQVATTSDEDFDINNPSDDLLALFQMLFETIESDGEHVAEITIETDEKSNHSTTELRHRMYETAAVCAFRLTKLKIFAQKLTVDQWHSLGWTLLNSSVKSRGKLLNILSKSIQMYPIHPRFLVYPCLFATEDSNTVNANTAAVDPALNILAEKARNSLSFAVRRLRRTHEELLLKRAALQDRIVDDEHTPAKVKEETTRLKLLADSYMPESILPYLLHLLSYHPEFPSTISLETELDRRRMKAVVRSIRMLINVLQGSLSGDTNNLSYLFKQLNMINRFFVDRHDADNIGLHFVTRMTVKLLNEQVKTQDSLQPYEGDIRLPRELYKHRSRSKREADHIDVIELEMKDGLEEAEQAIEKVLQIAGKGQRIVPARNIPAGAVTAGPSTDRLYEPSSVEKSTKQNSSKVTGSSSKRKSAAIKLISPDGTSRLEGSASNSGGNHKKSKGSTFIEEAPTRMMPRRNAKATTVSYKEVEEDEKEVRRWESDAAEKSRLSQGSDRDSLNPWAHRSSGYQANFSQLAPSLIQSKEEKENSSSVSTSRGKNSHSPVANVLTEDVVPNAKLKRKRALKDANTNTSATVAPTSTATGHRNAGTMEGKEDINPQNKKKSRKEVEASHSSVNQETSVAKRTRTRSACI